MQAIGSGRRRHDISLYCCLFTSYGMRSAHIPRLALLSRCCFFAKRCAFHTPKTPPKLDMRLIDSIQLEATGRENKEIQEAQSAEISEMEEQLRLANEDKERLKADARKAKAHSKVGVCFACVCLSVCINTFSVLNYETMSITEFLLFFLS